MCNFLKMKKKKNTQGISLKSITKQILPPFLFKFLKKFIKNKSFVSYATWLEAENASKGYDSENIIEKIKNSAKLVFDGKATYERDSVIFSEIQYSYPLLASILFVAANSDTFRVIDFGGGLGTTFQQNKIFLTKLKSHCDWRIVEKDKLVSIGKKEFTNNNLSFYSTIADAAKNGIDAIIFAGVICYICNPYNYLNKAIDVKAPFIIFDRTPIVIGEIDTFAVQYVENSIYKASLPKRNFGYENLIKIFQRDYDLIEEWVCDMQPDNNSTDMGFIFKRKSM